MKTSSSHSFPLCIPFLKRDPSTYSPPLLSLQNVVNGKVSSCFTLTFLGQFAKKSNMLLCAHVLYSMYDLRTYSMYLTHTTFRNILTCVLLSWKDGCLRWLYINGFYPKNRGLRSAEKVLSTPAHSTCRTGLTLIKNEIKFSSYIRKFRVERCKVYMTNGLLIYGEIFAHFFIY
jgi:hypothetical protein